MGAKGKQGKKGKKGKRTPATRTAAKAPPRAGQPSVAATMDQMLQAGATLDAIIKATGASRGRVVGHVWHRRTKGKAHIVASQDGTLKWNSR